MSLGTAITVLILFLSLGTVAEALPYYDNRTCVEQGDDLYTIAKSYRDNGRSKEAAIAYISGVDTRVKPETASFLVNQVYDDLRATGAQALKALAIESCKNRGTVDAPSETRWAVGIPTDTMTPEEQRHCHQQWKRLTESREEIARFELEIPKLETEMTQSYEALNTRLGSATAAQIDAHNAIASRYEALTSAYHAEGKTYNQAVTRYNHECGNRALPN